MKEEKRILNVLGQVDEKYIDEAAPGKKANKKPAWKKWTSIAACLALVAVLGVGALQSGWFSSNDIARLDGGETISFVKANTMPGALSLDLDVNTRALTEEETEALFADMPVAANAIFAADDNKLLGIDGTIGDVKIVIATSDVQLLDTVIDGSVKPTVIDGISVTAGYFLTNANSKGEQTAIYYATFELGSNTIYVENAGTKADQENVKNDLAVIIQELIANGEIDTVPLH